MKGKGQGTKFATPEKPLPLPGVSRVYQGFFYFGFKHIFEKNLNRFLQLCFLYPKYLNIMNAI
jgi:hypothetical protein